MVKRSKQRDAIINCLADRMDHPTAETIYKELKQTNPSISLGTVYRNLNQLVSWNTIQKISTGFGPDRFDPTHEPHAHFYCTKCGCVSDITVDDTSFLLLAKNEFTGQINGHISSFYGLCSSCLTQ